MKRNPKNKPIFWAVILLLFVGLAMLSYWWKTKDDVVVTPEDEDTEIFTDTLGVETDTVIVFSVKPFESERKTAAIYTKVSIDYPVTNSKPLQQSIVDFVVRALTDDFTWGGNARPAFKGDKTDGQTIVDFFINDKVREISEERSRDSLQQMAPWNEVISIKMTYESARTVSYVVNFGGDHGGVGDGCIYGVTFDKAEGHAVSVLKNPKDPHLKSFLVRYFEKHQNEDILSLYFPEELESHPVPKKAPYIMGDGVHFLYQKYEIGPGAMGVVEMVIPVADLSPYLSDAAKQLK